MASENRLFTDGVIVIILTACSYLSAYAYEVGYCRALGIPSELINITISNILSTGLFAAVILSLAFQYLNTPIIILNIAENKILNKLFYKHGIILAISIVTASNFGFELKQSLYILSIPTLTLAADLIPPLFDKKDSYIKELDRWLSISDENNKGIISSIKDAQA